MSTIELKPVTSSNLDAVGYDREGMALHVRFKNGGTYVYCGITAAEERAFMASPSLGAHLNKVIRRTATSVSKIS